MAKATRQGKLINTVPAHSQAWNRPSPVGKSFGTVEIFPPIGQNFPFTFGHQGYEKIMSQKIADRGVQTKSQRLAGRRIALGVCGGIAAVETVKVARELRRHGAR